MKITQVKIRRIFAKDQSEKVRTIASVTFDDVFVVHDIKIIDGLERRFISMPNHRARNDKIQDIAHPINAEFRSEVETAVLNAYNDAIKQIGKG